MTTINLDTSYLLARRDAALGEAQALEHQLRQPLSADDRALLLTMRQARLIEVGALERRAGVVRSVPPRRGGVRRG